MTYLTPAKLAKFWLVSPKTVTNLCDKGLLKHHRVPNGGPRGHRRIKLSDAVAFAEKHGLPCVLSDDVDFDLIPQL